MSLQRAYVLLAGLYSLLPVIGIVAVFSGGGTPLAMAYLFLVRWVWSGCGGMF